MSTDFIRLILAVIGALAALSFAVRINDDWPRMSAGWKVSRLSLVGLVLLFTYGPIELMLVEPPVPLGLRVYFAFALLLGLIVGLFMVRHEHGMDEGWIKASEVQAILDKVENHHAGPCHHPGCLEARDEMKTAIKEARREAASR